MSVLLDEETTTVVLDELEFDVPCEAGDKAATVWMQCRACRKNAAALCDDHCRMKRDEVDRKLLILPVVQCAMCLAVGPTFDALFEVVPL